MAGNDYPLSTLRLAEQVDIGTWQQTWLMQRV